jgi:sarcosine oxidase subunit gamma
VAELIATGPFDGLSLPRTAGACAVAAHDPGPLASVAPFAGQAAAVAAALEPLGLAFPGPGGVAAGRNGARLVWTGRGQAFLMGAAPPDALRAAAAVTDQTDGWAALRVEGRAAADVLARLVAIDLRPAALPPGRAARVLLNHMPAILIREGDNAFTLLVFRSMARTALHEIDAAMRMVAARG